MGLIAGVAVWIKTIIFVLLFAVFAEMLLPAGGMRRFIRVILGLFIMLAVLNPVLDIIQRSPADRNLFSAPVGTDADGRIAAAVRAAQSDRDRLALETYRRDLSRQIRAVTVSVEYVADAAVSVVIQDDRTHPGFGALQAVSIAVRPGKRGEAQPVAPVPRIGNRDAAGGTAALPPGLAARVQGAVSEVYQLRREQVTVGPMQ